MCTGGSAKKDAKKQRKVQQQQMEVQQQQFTEQMTAQRQQLAVNQAQYEEQFEIANAAPPPAPNPVAEAAAMATDVDSGAMTRMGSGRRAMRSDLTIPVAQAGEEPAAAVQQGTAKYEGAPRRSKAREVALAVAAAPATAPAPTASPTAKEQMQSQKAVRKAARVAAKAERRASRRGGLSIPGNYVSSGLRS
jgi:hypothetical protein